MLWVSNWNISGSVVKRSIFLKKDKSKKIRKNVNNTKTLSPIFPLIKKRKPAQKRIREMKIVSLMRVETQALATASSILINETIRSFEIRKRIVISKKKKKGRLSRNTGSLTRIDRQRGLLFYMFSRQSRRMQIVG